MFSDKNFNFWTNYLKGISLFFAFIGLVWVIVGSFDPFGIYDSYFAQTFWKTAILPQDAKIATQFLLVPLGATNAGYFILQYFIGKHAFAKRELWAYQAIVRAFLVWFILDSAMCLYYAGYFNILIANIPTLMVMTPIFFTRKYFVKR